MNTDNLLALTTTKSTNELQQNEKHIKNELQTIGLTPSQQQKMLQFIHKITHITTNPKTRKSFILSFLRIIQENIEKDGRDSSIIVEITKKCNKNCTHCYSKYAGQLLEMSDITLNLIVDFAKKNFKHIFFTGGEPTLDPRILTLAEKNPDMMFFLFTNGSTFTKEYATQLSQLGNVIPLIGIDGNSANTHDTFRGKGSYTEVMNAIHNLNTYNVSWGFITLVTETNAQEVLSHDFLDDKLQKGAIIARFLEYLPIGPNPLIDCILSGETYYHMEKRKNEIVKSGKIYTQEIEESKCNGLLFFTVNGDIKNCFCFHYAKYNVEENNIKETIEKTRREWISYTWDGECPIYSDPIGFKNHLEHIGWKNLSVIPEPYLNNQEIAEKLRQNYKQFLKIKAERGL